MILSVCAVFDTALQAYKPAFAVAVGQIQREFSDMVNNPQSEVSKHPDDYELYELGEFDDVTASFVKILKEPRLICRGKDLVRKPN